MLLRCYRCGYVWDYHGANPYYATCPHCFRKISIAKSKRIMKELGISDSLSPPSTTNVKPEKPKKS